MTLVDDDTNSIIADTVNNTWIDREMHNVDEEITKGVGRQGGVLWSFKDGDHRTSSLTILGIFICITVHTISKIGLHKKFHVKSGHRSIAQPSSP